MKIENASGRWVTYLNRVLVLILALVLGQAPVIARQPTSRSAQTVTRLNTILSNPNPSTLAGQRVELRDVPVGQVLNERLVLLGEDGGKQLLVRLPHPITRLHQGQRIDVGGVIDQMPVRLQPWNPDEAWNLNPAASAVIRKHRIFLNAMRADFHYPPRAK